MFGSDKKNANFEKPHASTQLLQGISVRSIPPEFYNGATGDGLSHRPEEKKSSVVTPQPNTDVAPIAPVVAEQKIPAVPSMAQEVNAQLTKSTGKMHRGMIIGFAVLFVVLFGLGGYVYWDMARTKKMNSLNVQQIVVPDSQQPAILEQPIETPPETQPDEIPKVTSQYPIGLREYQLALDSDLDNLSDVEEREVYGSDPLRPDDDSDGFVDGHEVYNLYNPAGFKPVALKDTKLVQEYVNNVFGYALLYPAVWTRDPVDADGQSVLFTSETGEYFELITHPNKKKDSLIDWYLPRVSKVNVEQVRMVSNLTGVSGLLSPDSLSWFVARGEVVYELRYDIGVRIDANFMRTFEMMQNSFHLTTEPNYIPEEIKFVAPTNVSVSDDTTDLGIKKFPEQFTTDGTDSSADPTETTSTLLNVSQ